MPDIEDYRTYLATHNPIAEIETRFLDPADDLICLAPDRAPSSTYSRSPSPISEASDGLLTPVPHRLTFSAGKRHSRSSSCSSNPVSVSPKARDISQPSLMYQHRPADHLTHSSTTDEKHGVHSSSNTIKAAATHAPVNHPHETKNTTTSTHPVAEVPPTHSDFHPQTTLLSTFVVILLPVLMFPLITDSTGRMAVLLVAGLVVSALRRGSPAAADLEGGGESGSGSMWEGN